MSTLVVIASKRKALSMMRWAEYLAADDNSEFLIVPQIGGGSQQNQSLLRERNQLIAILKRHIEDTNLNARIMDVNNAKPIKGTLDIIQKNKAKLVVLETSRNTYTMSDYDDYTNALLKRVHCKVILVDPGKTTGPKTKRTVIPMRRALSQTAYSFAEELAAKEGSISPFVIAPTSDPDAFEIANKEIDILLKEIGKEAQDIENLKPIVVSSEQLENPEECFKGCDLLLIAASRKRSIYNLAAKPDSRTGINLPRAMAVAMVRPPMLYANAILSDIYYTFYSGLPEPTTMDRQTLFERVYTGARLTPDFWFMMALSVGIATIGLMKDSEAVVIGAMLVAPLMTPLIGASLALILSDFRLFKCSVSTMGIGILLGLGMSYFLALLTPTDDLTLAVVSRGTPNLLDLFIALLSGMAAGYAFSRIAVAEAIVGVAVAAALVPPLCSIGVSLAEGNFMIAEGAVMLFMTNIVAIILGSALVLRILRYNRLSYKTLASEWVKRVVLGLAVCLLVFGVPLQRRLSNQILQGQVRPAMLPLSSKLAEEIKQRVDQEEDVNLFLAGRSGNPDRPDIRILLVSAYPVRDELIKDIAGIVEKYRGTQIDLDISIIKEHPVTYQSSEVLKSFKSK